MPELRLIEKISNRLKISRRSVYKWFWDKIRQDRKSACLVHLINPLKTKHILDQADKAKVESQVQAMNKMDLLEGHCGDL